MRKTGLLAMMLAMAAFPAQAVSIKNLGDKPYTMKIEQLGSTQEITIQPSQRYIRNGVGILLYPADGGSPIRAHQLGEYAIWPDGRIYIQRYDKVQLGDD